MRGEAVGYRLVTHENRQPSPPQQNGRATWSPSAQCFVYHELPVQHGPTHTRGATPRTHTHTHTRNGAEQPGNRVQQSSILYTRWIWWRKQQDPFQIHCRHRQLQSSIHCVWLFAYSILLPKVKLIFLQHLRVSIFVPVELLTRAWETSGASWAELENNTILNLKLQIQIESGFSSRRFPL